MSIASNFPAIKPSLNLSFALTKQLDSRVTFTRASTGTYYDGVTTAKAEENLFTYSQEFDNAAWTSTDATITPNTVSAPDGTTTADTFKANAGTGITPRLSRSANIAGSAVQHMVSFFAKKDTHDYIQIYNSAGTAWHCNFDLNAGTVGTSNNCTGSIVSFVSGWYRCIVLYTPTNTADIVGRPALVSSSSAVRAETWNPLGTETVFLWGAQLEQRSVVTAYTATTTQAITNYIPVLLTAQSGVPRFDHNPTTDESLGLLIEESRTNLVLYSEQFDNAAWTKGDTTVTANAIAAPNGTITADKLNETATTAIHQLYSSISASAQSYTWSVYARAGERTVFSLGFSGTTARYAWFDLSSGTVVSATNCTATITNVGNSWYRCTLTATAAAETTYPQIFLGTTASGYAPSYTGDGYSGIYIWGAQLEAGAFATSYIQTVAATVTRAADAASMTGTNFSSWYNAGEGTLFTEAKTLSVGSASRVICEISNGTTSNRSQQTINPSGSLVWFVNSGGVASANSITSGSTSSNTNFKIASAYKVNDFATVGNAQAAATSTSGNTALDQNNLRIGARFDDTLRINGTIKKFAYYPIRCTNAQLQALTS